MTKLISIVVPVFRAKKTIKECLNSILDSIYQDIEVIAVDDGSDDGSGDLCDEIAQRDLRLKVIHQENKGRSAARAAGIAMAKGEWVCFVDADDKLPTNALTFLSEKATTDVDIVLGNGYSIAHLANKRTVIDIQEFRHWTVRGEGTIGVPWGTLYRRTLATPDTIDMPHNFPMGEDYVFWLRIVFKTVRPVAIVYEKVYDKGEDTTSSVYVWTSAYAERIQKYRLETIPLQFHNEFREDMISDCLVNLLAVSLDEDTQIWRNSEFWHNLKKDMHSIGYRLPLKTKLFLSLPNKQMRRLWRSGINFALLISSKLKRH